MPGVSLTDGYSTHLSSPVALATQFTLEAHTKTVKLVQPEWDRFTIPSKRQFERIVDLSILIFILFFLLSSRLCGWCLLLLVL
jgi:hypothetical protein